MWEFLHDDFVCVILNPRLRRDPDYQQLHGKKLNFNGKKSPFRRLSLQSALEGFLRWGNIGNSHELPIQEGIVELAEARWLHVPLTTSELMEVIQWKVV